jgi:hypothetical protein
MRHFELVLGLTAAVGGLAASLAIPGQTAYPVEAWTILLAWGGTYLGVGMVRDVAKLLFGARKKIECTVACAVCLESILGTTVVLLGLASLLLGVTREFALTPSLVALHFGAVIALNGLLKHVAIAFHIVQDHRAVRLTK